MPSLDMSESSKIPPLFMCPISLCMMEDPVTLPSGITYDRTSVEKWLQVGKYTCPVTMKVIGSNPNLIPNHTIRSMILNWKSSNNIQTLAVAPQSTIRISHIIDNIACDDYDDSARRSLRLSSLGCLRSLIESGQIQNSWIQKEGLVAVLDSFLCRHAKHTNPSPNRYTHNMPSPGRVEPKNNNNNSNNPSPNPDPIDEQTLKSLELSVSILALLQLSRGDLALLSNPLALSTISWLLKERVLKEAATVIEKIATECRIGAEVMKLITSGPHDVIGSLFNLLTIKGKESEASYKSGLTALSALQQDPSTKASLVKAMVEKEERIEALIELLAEAKKGYSERILSLLSTLCLGSHRGRAFVRAHALSVSVVVRSLLVMSDVANEFAVTILWCLICSPQNSHTTHRSDPDFETTITPARVASHLSASRKLLVVAQMDCTTLTKQRIRDLLKELERVKCPGESFPNTSQRLF